jgi:hypothetical protein
LNPRRRLFQDSKPLKFNVLGHVTHVNSCDVPFRISLRRNGTRRDSRFS